LKHQARMDVIVEFVYGVMVRHKFIDFIVAENAFFYLIYKRWKKSFIFM